MRYVMKGDSPDFFEDEKKQLDPKTTWDSLHCKPRLRQYLIAEQSGLCIYCEHTVNQANSHIEHLIPQSHKPALRFEYTNLAVSCNGEQCDTAIDNALYDPEDIHSCGHKKSDAFDRTRFLNPALETAIGDYFSYNKTTCAIEASTKGKTKANYMIDELLNLDNPRLNNERSNARAALQKQLKARSSNPSIWRQYLQYLLAKDNIAFISFLRYYYSHYPAKHPR